MKIYVSAEDGFKCHVSDNGGMIAVETDFFNGKCDAYIEGYLFVPSGESWTRSDGVVFNGEMVTPWKPYKELDEAQREYEQQIIADMQKALDVLGVTV